jgi:hypothetical protein
MVGGIVLAIGVLSQWGCSDSDPSIVISEKHGTNGGNTVENGEAYDQAAIDIEKYTKIILPDTAEVRHEGEGTKLQVFMKKHMSFHGHPPKSMSIRTGRKNMGCSVKNEGGALVLATFGEWSSKEGGSSMGVTVQVPKAVKVEQRSGLSGEASAGREWKGAYLTKPKEVKEGWWYGPASPAEGWKAIPDVPDPKRRAADSKYPPPLPPKPVVFPQLPKAARPADPPES